MLWTGKHGNFPILNRNHWVSWIVRCKVATRAVNPAGRAVLQEFRRAFSGQPTDRSELFTMLITADQWDSELIQQKKRQRPTLP
jgi:hypothetical protein